MGLARRVVVISDLHLGGAPPAMMSRPERLADFVRGLPARRRPDERLELVIAGDFIDFLALPPFAAWTPDPRAACAKLEGVIAAPPFGGVFEALGALVAGGHGVTVLVGNHDVELALPAVQDRLLRQLGASPYQVQFVDDNRAYRAGGLLVEHGNRYDGANANDWTGLRAIASAQSRGEAAEVALEVSAGSRLVEALISPLKAAGYAFIDLLQPEGELVALLLVAFEPALVLELPRLARALKAQRLRARTAHGPVPGATRHVAAAVPAAIDAEDPELAAAFGPIYRALRTPPEHVSAAGLLATAWRARHDSLSQILDRGDAIPPDRLAQIRVAMTRLLAAHAAPDPARDACALAAQRLLGDDVTTVVMGHTHGAVHVGDEARASYINTGTWADAIRCPPIDTDAALHDFLAGLRHARHRVSRYTYADIRVEASGVVSEARLAEQR